MTAAETRTAVRQFDDDWSRFLVILFDADLAKAAGRLADAHAIRGCDAVHLASFEDLLARCDDEDVRFSGTDARLLRAARALG